MRTYDCRVYKYPGPNFVGELKEFAGRGNYSFQWKGKDHLGNQLPDGVYEISVRLKNTSGARIGFDTFDTLILHVSNNTPPTPQQCFFVEYPGSADSQPATQEETFCTPQTQAGTANQLENCVSCPVGQSIVFNGGVPIGCSPLSETSTEKVSFQIQGTEANPSIQPYVSKINNACSAPLASP